VSDRLAAARDYVARKPTDRFGLYALAMELRKAGAHAECFATFDTLLEHHPRYGAAFYHYGMAKKEAGELAAARAIWTRGLDATRGSDSKTYAELESALEGDF